MTQKGNLIFADGGNILTDGKNYASCFDVGNTNKTMSDYSEITIEEYERLTASQEENE